MKALYIVIPVVLVAALAAGVMLFFAGCSDKDEKTAVLSFHSFDGGGPEYSITIDDPTIVTYTSEKKYAKANHEELNGAGYDEIFTFKGLKPGETEIIVTGESPITDSDEKHYKITVAEDLAVTIE